MTDQVQTPEAGAQPQETTSEVENLATEQVEQTEPEQVEQQPQQKVVPLAALHEERREKKELREKIRLMEERFGQLTQVVSQRLQPPPQEAEIPDVNVDPVAHFRAKTEALERELRQLREPVQQMRQQTQADQQMQALQAHVAQQEARFAQEKPDYAEALAHVKRTSFAGIKALGYSDQQAMALMHQEFAKLSHRIATTGGDVAEHVYEMALANGYTPKQAQQEKLQSLQNGVKAAKSLGSGGGVGAKVSLAALAEMPADEFAKAVGDESAWRKLMGG